MELFGEKRVSVVFEKATLKQTKDGAKVAKLKFAIRLDAENVQACPPEIKAAFEAVETRDNGITTAELGDKEIQGVNVEFYALPDSRAVTAALQSVNLTGLAVKREQEKGSSAPHLTFSLETQIDETPKLRYWIVDNIFNQLWAKFEVAQRVLLPTVTGDSPQKSVN